MLKISIAESKGRNSTLHLEGQLIGPWVKELDDACKTITSRGCRLKLDLADVAFIDREGALLLASLKSRSITLVACSPYVGEQLRLIQKESIGKDRQIAPIKAV